MKRHAILLLLLGCIAISACRKVPLTGRKQLTLLPESQLTSMSLTSYKQFLNENQSINSGSDAQMVKRVGNRIAKAVEKWLVRNKLGSRVKDFKWEFNLINENQVNAWAMPGGKVAIYTGILPVAKDETGLAVVMGHEVAHAVARHGNERMSQGLVQQLGAIGLAVALSKYPAQTQGLFLGAYGAGSQLAVMLPFSRKHEAEADDMGLIFMAMAGYNPKEAPAFWQRMKAASGGKAPPEFLSTHPSHASRVANLNKAIPRAMPYYNKSQKPSTAKQKTQSKGGATKPKGNNNPPPARPDTKEPTTKPETNGNGGNKPSRPGTSSLSNQKGKTSTPKKRRGTVKVRRNVPK